MNLWRTCLAAWILVALLGLPSLAGAQAKPEVSLNEHEQQSISHTVHW